MQRSWWWMASALLLVVGCARQAKIDEAKLGRLPIEDKPGIFTAQHNRTVAEANKAAADRAKDQADVFREVAKNELSAGKDRAKAAKSSLELGLKTNDEQRIRSAQRETDLAAKEVIAAKAKESYADRLVELRTNEAQLADDRVNAAQAELVSIQASVLHRHGIDPGVDLAKVIAFRDDANNKVMEQERKVVGLRDEVAAQRMDWDRRRQAFNVAQREAPRAPPVTAPKAAEKIRPEPTPSPSEPAPDPAVP